MTRTALHLLRLLRHWHRRIGVFAAVFLLFLAVSGIFLNHATVLQLDKYRFHASWLARWYGLKVENPTLGFQVGERLLVGANGSWLLNNIVIAENADEPLGAVEAGPAIYIAVRDSLYVFSPDGKLVDRISGKSLPALPLLAIGAARSQVIVQTASGAYSSTDGLKWNPPPTADVRWSRPVEIQISERVRIAALLAPSISAETLLLDLHSGRILGSWGPVFVDLIALILIALALTGTVMFMRSRRRHHTLHADAAKRA